MMKQAIKKNFWALAFGGLLTFLLVPTDSFAQSRQLTKRGEKGTYAAAKTNRNTSKSNYVNRKRTAAPNRASSNRRTSANRASDNRRTSANRASSNRRTSVNRASDNRRTSANRVSSNRRTSVNRASDNRRTSTNRASDNRRTSANRASRSNNRRYNNQRIARNARASYNYRANVRNDYCRNYYNGLTNWNRTFWTSVHYTPNYYNLNYSRFPLRNGFRAQQFRFSGSRYWLYDGVWFQRRANRYYAVDAPLGLCIDSIPVGGEIIRYRGDRYVIYRGTAYQLLPFGGFQVVQMLGRF